MSCILIDKAYLLVSNHYGGQNPLMMVDLTIIFLIPLIKVILKWKDPKSSNLATPNRWSIIGGVNPLTWSHIRVYYLTFTSIGS